MTDKPILYIYGGLHPNSTLSPPCGKAIMGLRYKQLDYDQVELLMPQQVRKVNPRGRLPALHWGGETVVDSSDILTRLDEKVPDPPLLPASAGDRARVKILEDWADEVVYFYGAGLRWGPKENFARMKRAIFSRLPAPVRQVGPMFARREASARLNGQGVGLKPEEDVRRELTECLDALETWLGESTTGFLVGDAFTRADLSVLAVIDQLDTEITPGVAELVRARPGISAWRDRLHALVPNASRGNAV